MCSAYVNTPCNKNCDDCKTICLMHPSMARLYACFGIHPAEKGAPTRLAGALNRSPQVITNWSARGVSIEGAIEAERLSGRGAAWILDGDGPRQVASHGRFSLSTGEQSSAIIASEPAPHGIPSWPFRSITRAQWNALGQESQERVEAVVCAMIRPPEAPADKQIAA